MENVSVCASGLNALYNTGLNPIVDKTLDITFQDQFDLDTDLCKLLNRYAYQGTYKYKTNYNFGAYTKVIPTLYIDGKDMGTLESLKIQEIKALAEPSPFGHGSKTVYDENVRKASEIKGSRINLDFDLPYEVQAMAPKGHKITAKLYKLAIYEKDGFFAEHSDTLHGDDHIGTLVMCLPVPHEGGAFILSDAGNELRLPFDEMIKDNKIPWVAFYTDVKHQVEVVKSGMRMTLQFDLRAEFKNDDEANDRLCEILGTRSIPRGAENVYKFQDINQEILQNIKKKIKENLWVPTQGKPTDSDSGIKKRDRPDDDEPLELEKPQSTKQPKPESLEQEDEKEDKDEDEEEKNEDKEDEEDDDDAEYEERNPDGIAILLRRKYGAISLSTEKLKGVDGVLYHALKDDFRVEVKHVVIEQSSSYEGGYQNQPIEVVALSRVEEVHDSEGDEETKVNSSNKNVPQKCKDKKSRGSWCFTHPDHLWNQRKTEYEKMEKARRKTLKKVDLVTGTSPKTVSKLVYQNYLEYTGNEAQVATYSYMHAALFIYPK